MLRSIRELLAELPDDRRSNFGLTFDKVHGPNGATRLETAFTMTRDGFTWLAMRFRGKRALAFQVAYTDAFNAMAAYVKNQREGLSYRRAVHELACKGSRTLVQPSWARLG